ncbi:hypothetical protein SAXI111661_03795 [Saccharomonospora xinjiangensis]|nr:hypothetical protein EYD13_06720 [Saccharomonospora xinjiangensis]
MSEDLWPLAKADRGGPPLRHAVLPQQGRVSRRAEEAV